MSGRLCCYKQQQHSKLLAQFVFKVSAFCFSTRTKMRAPLPDCRINNALIQFVPGCQDTRTQFVDVLDPPFSDIACSIISFLVMRIFMPKNSIVTNFSHLALGGPVIMPHLVDAEVPAAGISKYDVSGFWVVKAVDYRTDVSHLIRTKVRARKESTLQMESSKPLNW